MPHAARMMAPSTARSILQRTRLALVSFCPSIAPSSARQAPRTTSHPHPRPHPTRVTTSACPPRRSPTSVQTRPPCPNPSSHSRSVPAPVLQGAHLCRAPSPHFAKPRIWPLQHQVEAVVSRPRNSPRVLLAPHHDLRVQRPHALLGPQNRAHQALLQGHTRAIQTLALANTIRLTKMARICRMVRHARATIPWRTSRPVAWAAGQVRLQMRRSSD